MVHVSKSEQTVFNHLSIIRCIYFMFWLVQWIFLCRNQLEGAFYKDEQKKFLTRPNPGYSNLGEKALRESEGYNGEVELW